MKHVVGFSGGADSQACALWCRRRFGAENVILTNSNAGGNEHPLTDGWLRWYSETVHPVVFIEARVCDLGDVGTRDGATGERRRSLGEDAPLTFDRLAFVKGIFPSRKAQFCTEYLKLRPQQRWLREQMEPGGVLFEQDYERYTGVRGDESNDRAKLPECQWDEFFDCWLHRPLLRWPKAQVFAYLKEAGEEVNPLYRLGFSRVGCAPCINSGKEDVRNWAARFPEMIDKVRAWEQSVGRAFFAPCVPRPAYAKALKEWKALYLISGSPKGPRRKQMVTRPGAPPPPEQPINWIDEVVAWARTERGGTQFSLPYVEAEAAAGSCSSKYGLCE